MRLLIVLTFLLSPCTAESQTTVQVYQDHVDGLLFDKVYPASISINTQHVSHMEVDRFVEGNILFIDYNQLKTINTVTQHDELIVGRTTFGYREGSRSSREPAQFHNPRSFFQYNDSTVIVADSWNFCIRSVSRETNSTRSVAGVCASENSFADGPFSTARFSFVYDAIKLPAAFGAAIAVGDHENRKLRKLDMETEQVTTLKNFTTSPVSMILTPNQDAIMYTYYPGGIGKLDLSTNIAYRLINEYTTGYIDASLPASRFSVFTFSLVFLTSHVMMLADYYNGALRLINLENSTVTSVCKKPDSDSFQNKAGNIQKCELHNPRSLLPLPKQDRILVGSRSLGYISVTGLLEFASIVPAVTDVSLKETSLVTSGPRTVTESATKSYKATSKNTTSFVVETVTAKPDVELPLLYIVIIVTSGVILALAIIALPICFLKSYRSPHKPDGDCSLMSRVEGADSRPDRTISHPTITRPLSDHDYDSISLLDYESISLPDIVEPTQSYTAEKSQTGLYSGNPIIVLPEPEQDQLRESYMSLRTNPPSNIYRLPYDYVEILPQLDTDNDGANQKLEDVDVVNSHHVGLYLDK